MTTATTTGLHDVVRMEVYEARASTFPVTANHWGYQKVVAYMSDGSTHEMTCYLNSPEAALPVSKEHGTKIERRLFPDRPFEG